MLKDRGREDVRTAESDNFFISPSRVRFITEIHRKADDYKLNQIVLTYAKFEAQGGAAYLDVHDLKVLIVTDAPEKVQRLMRLIRAHMAWFVNAGDYLQSYQNLARPLWVDLAGLHHSLFE